MFIISYVHVYLWQNLSKSFLLQKVEIFVTVFISPKKCTELITINFYYLQHETSESPPIAPILYN